MKKTLVAALVLLVGGVCQAELQVQRAWPEKIYCKPGDTVSMEVVVANPDKEAASAKLVVELVHDIDTAVKLAEKDVTVEPGRTFNWQDKWRAKEWLGVELRATLVRGNAPLARKSEYFTCARSVHQVLMWGRGNHGGMQFPGTIDDIADKYAAEFSRQWRSQYGNFFDQFGWGPSDFDCLTPKEDRYWAGQTGYSESKTNTNKVYAAFRAQGIQYVTYGKAAGGGPVTYENLRRHPEMTGYTDGRPWLENYSAAYLDFMEALGPPKPGDKHMVPGTPEEMERAGYKGAGWFAPYTPGGCNWCSVWYPCTRDDVLDVGVDELIGSAKMFGYNGVRFDGEFAAMRCQTLDGSWLGGDKFDSEAANLRLVKRMKETIWKECPGYLFGYNAATAITWSIGADNTPPSFREKCKDDGLVANEGLAFPGDVTWAEYAGLIRREAEIVTVLRRASRDVPLRPQRQPAIQLLYRPRPPQPHHGLVSGAGVPGGGLQSLRCAVRLAAVGRRPAHVGGGGQERVGEVRPRGVVAAVRGREARACRRHAFRRPPHQSAGGQDGQLQRQVGPAGRAGQGRGRDVQGAQGLQAGRAGELPVVRRSAAGAEAPARAARVRRGAGPVLGNAGGGGRLPDAGCPVREGGRGQVRRARARRISSLRRRRNPPAASPLGATWLRR